MASFLRIVFIAGILLFASTLLKAQSQFTIYDNLPGLPKSYKPAYDNNFPGWAKMLYAGELNFKRANDAFENWMQNHKGEKSPIIRYYKLWRRAVEPYVAEDGSIHLPDMDAYADKLHQQQMWAGKGQVNKPKSQSDWSFLGPRETYILNENGSPNPPPAAPWQVNVYSLDVAATNDSILYCGTETGFVNKTTDKGLHWQLMAPAYNFGGGITAMAVSPDSENIVYTAGGNQLHKSTDGGNSWTPLLPVNSLFYADRLQIDPQNPSRIFAATGSGLYSSLDAGATWIKKWIDPVYDVEIMPNDSNRVVALTKSGTVFSVIFSEDAGQNFVVDTTFPTTYEESSGGLLAVTPANPDLVVALLLAANNTPYLLKGNLLAGSHNWTLKATGQTMGFPLNNGQGYFDLVLGISPLNENVIFAGTTTLYKTVNGGTTFTAVGGYTGYYNIHPDIQDMKLLPNGDTWVSTDGGMNLTTDNFGSAANHKIRVNGLIGSDMWGFDQGWNEDIIVGGRYHNGNTAIADFYQPKALRMGGAESPTGWVIQGKSRHVAFSDLGNGWILPQTAEGQPEGRFLFTKYPNMEEYGGRRGNMVFHPNYYGTIYLGEGSGFWRSSDMGVTWDLLHSFTSTVRYLQISFHNPDVIYADVVNHGLFRSADGGLTWTPKTTLTSPPNGTSNWKGKLFFAISPYDENVIYVCLQNGTWSADLGKVFMSTDGGNTWTNWTGSLSEYMKCLVVQPGDNNTDVVYLFTSAIAEKQARVYYRKQGMTDWLPFEENYPAGMKVNLALPFFRDSKLRVAGNCGVWESPMETTDFVPVINPWVQKSFYNCMLDTLFFDDHSILNHAGASWHWSISPTPAYIENADMRNPKVVLGSAGSFDVTLTVTINGQPYSTTITGMVTATTCPSIEDCSNPAPLPKDQWSVVFVDSQETIYPGLATMSFDNDLATIWHTSWSTGSDPYPHEVQINLGTSYKIFDFTYQNRQDSENGRIKEYELYITEDTANWGLPVKTGQFSNTAEPQTLVLDSAIVGHYFRLKALSEVNGNPWSSAAEFSLTGCKNNVGIQDPVDNHPEITAFPVPAEGIITITLPKASYLDYNILTLSGQSLRKGKIEHPGSSWNCDLQSLTKGMYLIHFRDQAGFIYRVKVIKS